MSKGLRIETWPVGRKVRFTGTKEQLEAVGILYRANELVLAAPCTAKEGGWIQVDDPPDRGYSLIVEGITGLFELAEVKVKNPIKKKYRELGLRVIAGDPPDGALVRYIGRRGALWFKDGAADRVMAGAVGWSGQGISLPRGSEFLSQQYEWYCLTSGEKVPFVLESDYQAALTKAEEGK